jgi:hypothetical protein
MTWWLTAAGTLTGAAAGVRDRDGVDMIGELLETTTARGLAGITCGVGLLIPKLPDVTGGFISCKTIRFAGIVNPNTFEDVDWLALTLVVIDVEFVTTGIEFGMLMGIGLDIAGAGLDMLIMPELIAVIDSRCRPSSISTESALFRPALRALGLRGSCS